MLSNQQCVLLKRVQTKTPQPIVEKPKAVEVEVSMQSAFNQFSLTIYKQHKE